MESLIEEYVTHIVAMDNTDYGNKMSVVQHNKHANRIRKIATNIAQKHPELKEQFFLLIKNTNSSVRIWAAHHILEVMNYNEDEQEKALDIIKQKAQEDSVEGRGNQMWLKNWQKS